MPNLFGERMTRRELLRHIGNVDQIGGLRRFVFNDGQGRGLEGIELTTGAGLALTVTPGRTLDILDAKLNGCSFAWLSPAGPVHPTYHDIAGTCGRDEDCMCLSCWVRTWWEDRQRRIAAGDIVKAGSAH